MHFDGSLWTTQVSSTGADLMGIWGTGAKNIYAVGLGGTIIHFDGASWSKVQPVP
jgi:hypothetical protein